MAAFTPTKPTMGFKEIGIAFSVGVVTGAVIVALARNHTMDFSVNAQGARFHLGKSGKMSKRKPPLDEETRETTSDEESGDEANPGDKPKDDPGDSRKDGNSPGAAGFSPGTKTVLTSV